MQSDPAANPDNAQNPQKPLILVVDDSRLMRLAIKKILSEDFTLQEGVDGEDGWEKLLAEPAIQVVFTDLSMPGLDGFGLLQRIRSSDVARIRDLPVIVITGNEDDESVKTRALSSGATDFITKPFQSVQIRARADAHAKSQRKLQAVTAALEEQTTVDALTQLSNARYFMQHGNEDLSFAVRHKSELAMIILELDDFAALTASMDEQARNQVLLDVAGVLRAQTRREDTVARLDAARFAVLLPASNSVGTRHLGKRILADIAELKFFHGGRCVKVSASMGVATPDIKADTSLEEIVKSAERRVAVALQAGGNCLVKDDQTTADALREAARVAEHEAMMQQQAEQEAQQRAAAELVAKAAAVAQARAAEEARVKAEIEARQRAAAEAEAARAAAETARLAAEEADRLAAVEAARQRAAAEAQAIEEQRRAVEEAERLRAEAQAREQAELEARERAEAQAREQAEAQAREQAEAQARATELARLAAEEQAQLHAEEEARQRAVLAEAQARALEEEHRAAEAAELLRIETAVRAPAEAQALAAAQVAESARLEAEEAARVAADEQADREAAQEIIARAAAQIRLHAEAQEATQFEFVDDVPATTDHAVSGEDEVAEPGSDSAPTIPRAPEYADLMETRRRAEHETAQKRAEAEVYRHLLDAQKRAQDEEEIARRRVMEEELARVETELLAKAAQDASPSGEPPMVEATPQALPYFIAALVRVMLPAIDALNRRYSLRWDARLDKLRKRI
ncbi:MAG: response regulator [Gammaproteobacteria bacterium]